MFKLKKYYQLLFNVEFWLFILAAVFSCWLMWSTFAYKDQQFIIDSKLYSDFGAHLPLIRSFSMGKNFPPQYPQFAGPVINYHYFFYLMVGFLELLGVNLVFALNLFSSLGFLLLLTMLYWWTKTIFKSKLAALISVILFLFNSSFSFVEFFKQADLSKNLLEQLWQLKHFVSFGPWDGKIVSAFWNLNIFTNQRHLALSYGLVLLLLFPIIQLIFNEKPAVNKPHSKPKIWQVLLIFLGFLLFPFLHQAGYAILLISVLMLMLLFKKFRQSAWLIVYLEAIVFSVPMFLALPSSYKIHFKFGFLSPKKELLSFLYYWLFNLGLTALLYPVYLLSQKLSVRKVLLVFIVFWLISNLWQFSPDMINNHKFVSFFLLGAAIANAGFLALLFHSKKILFKILAGLLLLTLTFSGIVDFFPILNDSKVHVDDYSRSDIMTYIKTYTEPDAVFLTTTYLYNPALLVGRKTFLDYGYFNWSLGYDDHERRAALKNLFSASISQYDLCQELTENQIDYILFSPGKGAIDQIEIKNSIIYSSFVPIYENKDGYQLFSVSDICFGKL